MAILVNDIRDEPVRDGANAPSGMENIVTAIAATAERKVAFGTFVAIVAGFVLSFPVAGRPLPEVPAFIPAIISAASLAQILTAILLFVQWRISGLAQLAILSTAYITAALANTAWMLTYPHVFAAHGLLGAHARTSSWIYLSGQVVFGVLVIAFSMVDRFPRPISAARMQLFGTIVVGLVVAGIGSCIIFGDALPAMSVGRDLTPLYTGRISPLLLGEYAVVLGVVAATGIRTVAHVWLLVVCSCMFIEIMWSGSISAQRFSVGWYVARFGHLVSASLLLYVFFVKINELLFRLAARNRRLTIRSAMDAVAIAEGEQRYRLLTNALPQLIWTTDPAGNVEYVNERWIGYAGLGLAESQQDGWLEAVHPADRDVVLRSWETVRGSGDPLVLEYRVREAESGSYRWFLISALAIRDGSGTIVRWVSTSTDIDVAKRIEERESFLATLSDRLAASIDITTTLDTVKAFSLSRLCDWCQIDLIDDDGRFVPAAAASIDSEENELLQTLVGHAVESGTQTALERIVERGEPIIIEHPMAFAQALPNPRDRAIYRRVKAAAAILVPLANGEARIGTLSLVFHTGRPISVDDVSFARDFSRRAALALEHARLYERERATADALQRAMLPAQLPLLDHVKFSASYSAASESQRVGGDFYDAFALPDGRVALTIGDVTGHGIEAAVIMGEIRQALRAAAFERAEPSAILDRASRLLVASGRSVFVTAIFGVLDISNGRFAYATAGHPPPLLFDGKDIIRLSSSGLPIGLRDDDGVDFALNLHAPCTLTLFTDGLMEFGRDLADGERRIEAAIHDLAITETEHLAAAIMKRVLGDDEATDDIAILTATIDRFPAELSGDEREWRFLSTDAGAAALARREIGALIGPKEPGQGYAAELAFGELIANAVRHAPGPVVARARVAPDGSATIELDDTGSGFSALPIATDLYAESGRGLALLRRFADDVVVGRAPGGGASVSVRFAAAG